MAKRIAAGQFTWKHDFRDLHPSPYGQQLYALSITRLLDAAWLAGPGATRSHPLPTPLDPASYDRGHFRNLTEARLHGGFALDPDWQPTDGKGTRSGYVRVPALVSTQPGAEFEFDFHGTAIGLMITSGPDAGRIVSRVDQRPEQTFDTRTPWSNQLHLPWALMLTDDLPDGPHTLRVRVAEGALRIFHFLVNGDAQIHPRSSRPRPPTSRRTSTRRSRPRPPLPNRNDPRPPPDRWGPVRALIRVPQSDCAIRYLIRPG